MNKFIILFILFYPVFGSIKIKELKVPESIESGTVDDVILDCDFETDEKEGIVVRWYINDSDPIYQWVPGRKPAVFKNRLKDIDIDLTYKINNDKNTMYRALHIINITSELSGNYTCKVSGHVNEDVSTKGMIIYEPADNGLDLSIFTEEASDHMIICEAEGIFPEPKMTISIISSNRTKIYSSDEDDAELHFENNLYNISTSLELPTDNITSSSFDYMCELTIPGTSYVLQKSDTFYTDPIETQIEEDFLNTTATEKSCNFTEGSGVVYVPSPNQCLLSTVLFLVLSLFLRY